MQNPTSDRMSGTASRFGVLIGGQQAAVPAGKTHGQSSICACSSAAGRFSWNLKVSCSVCGLRFAGLATCGTLTRPCHMAWFPPNNGLPAHAGAQVHICCPQQRCYQAPACHRLDSQQHAQPQSIQHRQAEQHSQSSWQLEGACSTAHCSSCGCRGSQQAAAASTTAAAAATPLSGGC